VPRGVRKMGEREGPECTGSQRRPQGRDGSERHGRRWAGEQGRVVGRGRRGAARRTGGAGRQRGLVIYDGV
jgi:hypothetical protein